MAEMTDEKREALALELDACKLWGAARWLRADLVSARWCIEQAIELKRATPGFLDAYTERLRCWLCGHVATYPAGVGRPGDPYVCKGCDVLSTLEPEAPLPRGGAA